MSKKPIKLIPIFILNFRIENELNDLIIRTKRDKQGLFKNKCLTTGNEFIDHLSYDMWVVQIPNLNQIEKSDYENDEYKTRLYQLFSLFDQQALNKESKHFLYKLKREEPEFLSRVITRLKSAMSQHPELREKMNVEDEFLSEIIRKNYEIDFFQDKYNEEKELRNKREQELVERAEELEKEKQAKQKAIKEAQEYKQSMFEFARLLKSQGKTITEISEMTKLSNEEIDKL
jgi:hypothetical protein